MIVKSYLLIILGLILLGIGTIGIIIPILPTMPFLILAFSCFADTPKIKNWLLKNRMIYYYIQNYQTRTCLKKEVVIKSLGTLWLTLFISILVSKKIEINIFLILIGISVTIHILWISKSRQ